MNHYESPDRNFIPPNALFVEITTLLPPFALLLL